VNFFNRTSAHKKPFRATKLVRKIKASYLQKQNTKTTNLTVVKMKLWSLTLCKKSMRACWGCVRKNIALNCKKP